MKQYEFDIGSTSDDEIVISQPVPGFERDNVILLSIHQIESFIEGLKAASNAVKRDKSRREELNNVGE